MQEKRNCLEIHPSDWTELPQEIWELFVSYMNARKTPMREKDAYFLYGRKERPTHKRFIGWFGEACTGYVLCTLQTLFDWEAQGGT